MNKETIFVYKVKKNHIPMSGICERGFMLMFKKFGILGALSELLEPHLFGKTGALKFGTIGVHRKETIFGLTTGKEKEKKKSIPCT